MSASTGRKWLVRRSARTAVRTWRSSRCARSVNQTTAVSGLIGWSGQLALSSATIGRHCSRSMLLTSLPLDERGECGVGGLGVGTPAVDLARRAAACAGLGRVQDLVDQTRQGGRVQPAAAQQIQASTDGRGRDALIAQALDLAGGLPDHALGWP